MLLIGFLAKRVKAISVNRDGSDVRALLDCFKCLKNNEKICIFPEGTRNTTDGDFHPFKHGAAQIAIKSKVPVVPVVIYKRPRFFRMTHVLVGVPIELTDYYDRKLTEEELMEADEKLREIMQTMRSDHKAYLENKKKGKKGQNA